MEFTILLLALFICTFQGSFGQSGCKGTVGGHKYDFTSLSMNGNDYQLTGVSSGQNYRVRLNICQPLNNLGTPPCQSGASACQYWPMENPTYEASLGMANTLNVTLLTSDDGPVGFLATFIDGVAVNGAPLQMAISLLCASSSNNSGPIIMSSANSDWLFAWPTPAACISHGGLSPGSVILICLLVLVIAYIVGGILINKFVRHEEGLNMIPNIAFWATIPGLVKGGITFVMNKVFRRGGEVPYNNL